MASGMINCIKEWRCYLKLANSRVVEKAASSNWQERHVILGCIRLGSASSGIHPNTRKVVEYAKLCKGSWCQASPKLRFAKISETQRKWCILHMFFSLLHYLCIDSDLQETW
ncbi:hypothetical protein BDA96_10G152500 [Sorghum bicolor]|uniref:Uncharacterized protein n=1 Tax=Sorghum bicolor TaxID=4558 RepID=A0A921Q4M6_SORBI|nr:hypothetical protein BDA96_10G152500 [Sorghum bicolor]